MHRGFGPRVAVVAVLSHVALLVSACSPSPASNAASKASHAAAKAAQGPQVVPGEFLVRWKPGAPTGQISTIHAAHGATVLRRSTGVRGLEHIRVPPGANAKAVLAAYRANPHVKYIEPNYVSRIVQTIPNDTDFGQLWGLHNVGQDGGTTDADINAPEVWDIATGAVNPTVVGVIDTGIDYTHPDLVANVWVNPMESAGTPGVDDDGNGYIDDLHGIDAINGDSDPFDDHSHGTHVSGTIAAVGNNASDVVGVNWQAQVVACKAFDSFGFGTTATEVECLDYMLELEQLGIADVRVTNNSWGDVGAQALLDAIAAHADAEILLVVAAGNDSTDNDALDGTDFPFPALSFEWNVITVAATDRNDGMAGFSNFGRRTVHLGAPGVDILSTVPGGGVGLSDGTSMASPHVAGVAALLASMTPPMTASEIKNRILTGAQSTVAMTGASVTGGRLRADDAVACMGTVQARLRPVPDSVQVPAGSSVSVHAIDITCDGPAGASILVDVNSGATTLTLLDDGVAPDDFAGDGRFAGTLATTIGTYVLDFPWGETQSIQAVPQYVEVATAYSPRTLSAPTDLGLDDEDFATIALPFPIRYGGTTYSSLNVFDNGIISPTESFSFTFVNGPLPDPDWTVLIAPFWDDLDPGAAGTVRWQVLGTTPNREVVIEWNGVPLFDPPNGLGSFTFQAVLSEATDDVLFNYVSVASGTPSDNGAQATIGVQQGSTLATQSSFETASTTSGSSRLYVLPNANSPIVAEPSYTGGPFNEGTVVAFTSSFDDPDDDGPWMVEWHSNSDGVPEHTDVAVVEGALSASIPVSQDPETAVRVVVVDLAGNEGASDVLVPAVNVPPVLAPLGFDAPPVMEGVAFQIVSTFTDAGVDDSPWVSGFDLDDDLVLDVAFLHTTMGGISSGLLLADDLGPITVNAAVFDEFDTGAGTFKSQSNLETVVVDAQDVDPIVNSFVAAPAGAQDEPATFSFDLDAMSGAIDDPSFDPITLIEWDLDGDGTFELATPGDVSYVEHHYPDSGAYTALVRVHDEDSSADATVAVTVNNLDPVAGPIPDATVTEGETVVIQATATDAAGVHDPITWSLTSGPMGMTVSATGVVAWTPSYAQSGRGTGIAHPVAVTCSDGDGGACNVAFTLSSVVRDDDADGMADTWEVENGLDPSMDDADGDTDGDGVSNVDEYTNENGGPHVPTAVAAVAPAADGEVVDEDPVLEVQNATDLDGGVLTYVFQIATSETSFGTPLAQGSAMQGATTTSITFDEATTDDPLNGNDVTLVDDTGYWWRAWARDDTNRDGPFLEPRAFFYNPVNDPPSQPGISAPVIASDVADTTPMLVAGNSSDPDDATRTYTFRVFSDLALTMEVANSGALTEGPNGLTAWEVAPPLMDNTRYWWTVTADDGEDTTANVSGELFVNIANDEPTAPTLVGPADGAILTQPSASLEVTNATDAEGDVLTYLFEIDTVPSFNSPDYAASTEVSEGAGTTTYAVSSLEEDTTYWWRARAFDGFAYGEWVLGTFHVNAANAAPTAPVAVSPADGLIVPDIIPTLRVANAADVEGDALTYVFTVLDEDGAAVSTSSPVTEGAGGFTEFTVLDETLKKGKAYTWSAVATDANGAAGPSSASASFSVYKKKGGAGGGGCSCSLAGVGTSPGALPAFACAALAALLVRRRRSR